MIKGVSKAPLPVSRFLLQLSSIGYSSGGRQTTRIATVVIRLLRALSIPKLDVISLLVTDYGNSWRDRAVGSSLGP